MRLAYLTLRIYRIVEVPNMVLKGKSKIENTRLIWLSSISQQFSSGSEAWNKKENLQQAHLECGWSDKRAGLGVEKIGTILTMSQALSHEQMNYSAWMEIDLWFERSEPSGESVH